MNLHGLGLSGNMFVSAYMKAQAAEQQRRYDELRMQIARQLAAENQQYFERYMANWQNPNAQVSATPPIGRLAPLQGQGQGGGGQQSTPMYSPVPQMHPSAFTPGQFGSPQFGAQQPGLYPASFGPMAGGQGQQNQGLMNLLGWLQRRAAVNSGMGGNASQGFGGGLGSGFGLGGSPAGLGFGQSGAGGLSGYQPSIM